MPQSNYIYNISSETLIKKAKKGDFNAGLELARRMIDERNSEQALFYIDQALSTIGKNDNTNLSRAYALKYLADYIKDNFTEAEQSLQKALDFAEKEDTTFPLILSALFKIKNLGLTGEIGLCLSRNELGDYYSLIELLLKKYSEIANNKDKEAIFENVLLLISKFPATDEKSKWWFEGMANFVSYLEKDQQQKVKFLLLLAKLKSKKALETLGKHYASNEKMSILFSILELSVDLEKNLIARYDLEPLSTIEKTKLAYWLTGIYFFIIPKIKLKESFFTLVEGIINGPEKFAEKKISATEMEKDPLSILKYAIKIDYYAANSIVKYAYKHNFINWEQVELFQKELPDNAYLHNQLQFTFLSTNFSEHTINSTSKLLLMAEKALKLTNITEKMQDTIKELLMQLLLQYDLQCSLKGIELWDKHKDKLNSSAIAQTIFKHKEIINSGKYDLFRNAIQNFKQKLSTTLFGFATQLAYQKDLVCYLDNFLNDYYQNNNNLLQIKAPNYEEFITGISSKYKSSGIDKEVQDFTTQIKHLSLSCEWKNEAAVKLKVYGERNMNKFEASSQLRAEFD